MTSSTPLSLIQRKVWDGQLPLEIKLASSECRTYDRSDPYLISYPRLSYLPLLLPRLHAFFSPILITDPSTILPSDGYFTYDSVPLKWHLPLGLLYDIYVLSTLDPDAMTPLPFRLTIHFSVSSASNPAIELANLISPTPLVVHDAFMNSVKEADFLRSGTAKPIMSLSAADSRALWSSIQDHDLSKYTKVYNSLLLPPPGQFRNIPLRVYLPSGPSATTKTPPPSSPFAPAPEKEDNNSNRTSEPPSIKVLQAHIPPTTTTTTTTMTRAGAAAAMPQTLGTALHGLVPSLFPSRRTPVLARPILHGAVVPMSAHLEELARAAGYADGWVGVVVVMNS